MNFDRSPLLVIWEVTQACDLACAHCRATVQAERDAAELTTAQGFQLFEEVKRFGNPLMVLTGGDPLKRSDLFELIDRSVSLGLRTNITPSATPGLTDAVIDRFKDAGVARLAIGIDGPDPASHNAFRETVGTFERGMAALHRAREIGLETQVQTTVTARNHLELTRIAERVFETGAKMWSLFFLAAPGSPLAGGGLTPEQHEKVFATLYKLSKVAPFDIKTAEAMHYRRFVAEREPRASAKSIGVGDGKGFVFISHRGEIFPSGFLPVSGGNVRKDSLVDVYRSSRLFLDLRNPRMLEGRCGHCEFQRACGGSRARAYALTGNYLAEDPGCIHQPSGAGHRFLWPAFRTKR